MRTTLTRVLIIFSLICGIVGCSSSSESGKKYGKPSLESPSKVDRRPWELWGFGVDLNGQSISDRSIRRADMMMKEGGYKGALHVYLDIDPQTLAPEVSEALAIRIASTQIALGQYKLGLETISHYFNALGGGIEKVSGPFALVLAYGYGALFDYDQSFAWFSRADSVNSTTPVFSNIAQHGARQLIASIPKDKFETVASKWSSDTFIYPFFEAERRYRASDEYVAQEMKGEKFWNLNPAPEPLSTDAAVMNQISAVSIGVLLPLTGSLNVLGVNTKNGVDLAFAVENEPRIHAVYKDTGEDVLTATNAAKELVANDKVNIFLGPLLSDAAAAVATVARDARVPELSLSKANNFETSDLIFRLGATTNSQVDALLETCSTALSMSKFALVYPETPVGMEYANSFKKYLNVKGLELVYEASFAPQDSEKMHTIVTELQATLPDGIFFPDSLERSQQFFSLFSPSYLDKVRPLGTALWDDPVQISNSQAAFNKAVFVSPFFSASKRPIITKFIDAYTNKYGKKPDFLAAQGFDAATMLIGAGRAMMDKGKSFELAFKDIEQYEGVTGTLRVDVSGEVQREYAVVESRDGELREVVRSDLMDQSIKVQ